MYKNEEWDYYFILRIWQKKFQDMKEYWSNKKNIHIIEKDRIRVYNQISECIEILNRLIEDDYSNCKEHKNFEKKWKNYINIANLIANRNKINKNKKEKKEEKEYYKDFKRVYKIVEKRKEKDKEKFFNIIKENYETWWD